MRYFKEYVNQHIIVSFLTSCCLMFIFCSAKSQDEKGGFADRLIPKNKILDLTDEGWAVWCCSPIYGPDNKVHVFFTRAPGSIETWPEKGEIAHATADRPEGPYTVQSTVLKGRGKGFWDGLGLINPRVYKVDGKYALFYSACEEMPTGVVYGMHYDKIGLLLSENLWEWTRANNGEPVLSPSKDSTAWDSYVTNNASFLKHPETGEYWLYYRGARPRDKGVHDCIGLARSKSLEGPYIREKNNPVVNTVEMKNLKGEPFRGFEDPCIWYEDGKYKMLVHDLDYDSDNNGGYYLESIDGVHWSKPMLGYHGGKYYWGKNGRVETPLLLLNNKGKPEYLFVNLNIGNRYSGFVFRIKSSNVR
jgi:hypothetical protein